MLSDSFQVVFVLIYRECPIKKNKGQEKKEAMYTISKQFAFSASHQLEGLADGHPCMRLHGHNYAVELILRCYDLDTHGFVVDYNDMKPFGEYIDSTLDHRHLNEVLPDIHPTAENLARHLYHVAWKMWNHVAITVRVSETPKTWAEYTQS